MNFRKLISNLPFNPSLVSQVAFYGKRVRQESSMRRFGFLLMALAMFVQMFAVISPPERSLAASPDHILDGAVTNADILAAWDRPGSDIAAIYGKFGVTRDNIAKLTRTPNVTIRSNDGKDYWTTGRNSLSNYSKVSSVYKNTEIALKVGSDIIYMRQLRAWDIVNPFNTYAAWQGKKNDGTIFWIFKDCGNYTQVGKFTPKTPELELRKTVTNTKNPLKPGDTYTFHFEYRNAVPDSLAENVQLFDQFDLKSFDIVSPKGLPIGANNLMVKPLGNLWYTANFHTIDVTVRLKNPYPGPKVECNAAKLTATNADEAWSSVCVTVVTPCQYDASIPAGPKCVPPVTPCKYDATLPATSNQCVPPQVVCSLLETSLDRAKKTAVFKTTVTSTKPSATKIVNYTYTFGAANTKKVKPSTALTDTETHVFKAGAYTVSAFVTYSVVGETGTTKKTALCSDRISFEDDKPLGEAKAVKNITQNLSGDKALNSTVKAGDVLEYTLTTSNSQNYVRKNITVSDYVGDIVDYADVDTAFLRQQGGTYVDANKKVQWTNVTIGANAQVQHVFRVKVKNPIPSTNSPSATSGTFDCRISNRYGNETNMLVQCPVVKGVENLPNTGPGTGAIFSVGVTMIVGYFFARSRLLARELDLIKQEYAPTGGF